MSQTAKTSRDAMKAKAKRLASADPHTKVDSSDWTPPSAENASTQTGMRPLSKRAYKKGGKVIGKAEGMKAAHRADRAPRKSGGRSEPDRAHRYLTPDNLINRDVRMANEAREGTKHIGGLKHGGKAHKSNGGGFDMGGGGLDMGQADRSLRRSSSKPKPKSYSVLNSSGKVVSTHDNHGDAMRKLFKLGDDLDFGGHELKANYKSGGRAHKFSGGVGENPVGQQNQMMGKAAGMMKKGGRAHKLSGGPNGTLQNYLEAARPELAVSKMMGDEEGVRKRSAGIRNASNKLSGVANAGNASFEMPDYGEMYPGKKRGGKTDGHKVEWLHHKKPHHAHGGKAHPDEAEDKKLMHKVLKAKAFKAEGGAAHPHDCKCHKCWGGKAEKNKGGGVFKGEGYPFKVPGEVKGGRSAHAHGGKAGKGKMNVNIIIASGHHDKGAMGGQPMPNAPVSPRTPPVGAGAPMPPPGMMPSGGGAPGAGGPPMPPPGMMPRKSGGRTTYPIDSGAGGGEARLEKIKAYGLTPPRKK